MKKNRNSFMSEYGYNAYNNMAMMPQNPNFVNQNAMNQGVSANTNSNFYAGPIAGNVPPNMNNNMYTDIDSRISRLERQVNRLETRINKLESDGNFLNEADTGFNNSMYMV